MTIKEVEMLLDIPRATVRFYEKEGLISPTREGNGYRDYSAEDVEKLQKIIILRKIGLPVEEINDLFDGVKTMEEALDANIVNLQKQMEELFFWKCFYQFPGIFLERNLNGFERTEGNYLLSPDYVWLLFC